MISERTLQLAGASQLEYKGKGRPDIIDVFYVVMIYDFLNFEGIAEEIVFQFQCEIHRHRSNTTCTEFIPSNIYANMYIIFPVTPNLSVIS